MKDYRLVLGSFFVMALLMAAIASPLAAQADVITCTTPLSADAAEEDFRARMSACSADLFRPRAAQEQIVADANLLLTRRPSLTRGDAANVHEARAKAYVWLNQPAAAIADVTLALSMTPEQSVAKRADLLAQRGYIAGILIDDVASATADYEAAIALTPGDAMLWWWLARIQANADLGDEAVATLQAGIAAAPGEELMTLALGDLLFNLERYAEAIPVYETYLAATNDPSPLAIARLIVSERRAG